MVDANGTTRRLLQERLGRFEAPTIPFPVDRYSVERKEFMSRQTGCDPTVQHKIIKVREKGRSRERTPGSVPSGKK